VKWLFEMKDGENTRPGHGKSPKCPYYMYSVLPLPVGTGPPRPLLSKKSIDFDHEIMTDAA
jgi:hypothetical protein